MGVCGRGRNCAHPSGRCTCGRISPSWMECTPLFPTRPRRCSGRREPKIGVAEASSIISNLMVASSKADGMRRERPARVAGSPDGTVSVRTRWHWMPRLSYRSVPGTSGASGGALGGSGRRVACVPPGCGEECTLPTWVRLSRPAAGRGRSPPPQVERGVPPERPKGAVLGKEVSPHPPAAFGRRARRRTRRCQRPSVGANASRG